MAAIVVFWLSNGVLPDLALFGEVDYLGAIGALAALALWIATYGFGEEISWRGFAFHRMEGGGWVQAAVMIGVLWGLWHLPYFFYKANFIALGIGGFAGYLNQYHDGVDLTLVDVSGQRAQHPGSGVVARSVRFRERVAHRGRRRQRAHQ